MTTTFPTDVSARSNRFAEFVMVALAYGVLPFGRIVFLAFANPLYDPLNEINRRRDKTYIILDLLASTAVALTLWHWYYHGLSPREPILMIALRTLIVSWWYFEWSFGTVAQWVHRELLFKDKEELPPLRTILLNLLKVGLAGIGAALLWLLMGFGYVVGPIINGRDPYKEDN